MQTANNHIYFVNTVNLNGLTLHAQRTSVLLFIEDIANGSCGAGSWEHCFATGLSDDRLRLYAFQTIRNTFSKLILP